MGLELSSTSKEARHGNITPWQLARKVADGDASPELWREYAEGMRGCHQLQWSRGLRDAIEPAETDGECISEEFQEADVLGEIPRETWRDMAKQRGALAHLRALGKLNIHPEEGRSLLKDFFERWAGGGATARWQWVLGRAFLRWDSEPDLACAPLDVPTTGASSTWPEPG